MSQRTYVSNGPWGIHGHLQRLDGNMILSRCVRTLEEVEELEDRLPDCPHDRRWILLAHMSGAFKGGWPSAGMAVLDLLLKDVDPSTPAGFDMADTLYAMAAIEAEDGKAEQEAEKIKGRRLALRRAVAGTQVASVVP